MIIKKLAKLAIAGAVAYGFGEFAYQAGKGNTLALLSHYDATAADIKKDLTESESLYPEKLILLMCAIFEWDYARNEEGS